MGGLRIEGPSPFSRWWLARKDTLVNAVDAGESGAAATYAANLAKLIPGEALSLYALGANVQVPVAVADNRVLPVVCLAAAIAFRWLATRSSGWRPQVSAVFIAAVSFVLWIYGQNDWFLTWKIDPNYKHIVGYALLFWVFVLPGFIEGDKAG